MPGAWCPMKPHNRDDRAEQYCVVMTSHYLVSTVNTPTCLECSSVSVNPAQPSPAEVCVLCVTLLLLTPSYSYVTARSAGQLHLADVGTDLIMLG